MGKYNFDEVIDRHGTDCLKYDFGMKRKGRDDLLPLWVADMDFRLPDEILDEFHKRIDHGIFGYTDPLDEYFAAMNHWFSTRYGYTIEPDWVTLGAGIVYALGTSVRAFTEKGDAMMVMQPVYYPFSEVIKNDGRRLVNCQLRYENNHYSIDFEKMERMILEEGVKALIFCNPHNPVGRVWTREELERVAEICLKYNVTWMVDEMHCDFIFPGHTFTSCMNLDEKYRQILALYSSPGKTFNVAGLQPANIIIPNEELRKKYQWANTQAAYSQGSLMGQLAVKVCYTKGAEWVDELVQYIYENVKYMSKFVKENFPKAKMVEPEGTYLVWVDFSGYGLSNEELEHLMLDCMNTPNRDGIDPVDCHDLSVRHCCIMAGDDGFCLKTADRMGCRNIFAEDLVIQSLASAIKIGTDSYAKVENVTVRRCILKNVNRCGIAVETVDGAAIRNCTFEDIDMTDCGGPMYMTIGHRNRKAPQLPVRVGSMAHIAFRRIGYRAPYLFSRCKTVYESLFIGDSAENKIRDVLVADCDLLLPGGCRHGVDAPQPIGEKYPEYDRHGLSSGAAFTLRFCEDVRFENNVIQTEKPDVRPLVMIHDC